jgi:hypothetical protein
MDDLETSNYMISQEDREEMRSARIMTMSLSRGGDDRQQADIDKEDENTEMLREGAEYEAIENEHDRNEGNQTESQRIFLKIPKM